MLVNIGINSHSLSEIKTKRKFYNFQENSAYIKVAYIEERAD